MTPEELEAPPEELELLELELLPPEELELLDEEVDDELVELPEELVELPEELVEPLGNI